MKYDFGFIGCGNMGGALLSNVAANGPSLNIAVNDLDMVKVRQFEKDNANVTFCDLETLVTESEYIVIGVKPQALCFLFSKIAKPLQERDDAVIITMCAGISTERIAEGLGKELPVIRIMPNTPAKIGKGVVLYSLNPLVSDEREQVFLNAFSGCGLIDRIPEDKIDAASALSGCGPAYLYIFAEALADGAVECGLPRDKANLYAAAMLEGSAAMLLEEKGVHSAALKDAVCSPGGTTIAGVHALEEHSFRAAAMNAVVSAFKRTLELK